MKSIEKGKEILKKIQEQGYSAYMVGGAIRDYLLHKDIHDVDMTTNMPLEELSGIFTIKDNGSNYQSVTILYEDMEFEITRFRKDVSYADHRHPIVEAVDTYYEDSKRRDFTINAMAMDLNGNILDYYQGQEDLKNQIIRTIGDPFVRFEEDALRILRGLYLSSKLGFTLDSDTLFAMVDKKELLGSLSEERIYQYFIKILYADTDQGIRYINECDIFQYIPSFKRWLNLVDKTVKEEDLMLYYYAKMKRFPMTPSKEETKLAKAYDLFMGGINSYILFQNKEAYLRLRNVLSHFGFNCSYWDKKLEDFPISSPQELAVTMEKITEKFIGVEKKKAIERVMLAILDGEIQNTEKDIFEKLRSDDHV